MQEFVIYLLIVLFQLSERSDVGLSPAPLELHEFPMEKLNHTTKMLCTQTHTGGVTAQAGYA